MEQHITGLPFLQKRVALEPRPGASAVGRPLLVASSVLYAPPSNQGGAAQGGGFLLADAGGLERRRRDVVRSSRMTAPCSLSPQPGNELVDHDRFTVV
jgi:hypothetical protein